MKIVVLDSNFAGDVSFWKPFRGFEGLKIVETASTKDVLDLAGDAEAIVCSRKIEFDAALLDQLPSLKYIGLLSTGYNNVDIEGCRERDIVVTNVPGYSSESVAQTTFSLLLELCQGVGGHDGDVRGGGWGEFEESNYGLRPNVELAGLKMGIFGFGAIGQAVARIARGFGMDVLVNSRTDRSADFDWCHFVSLEELFKESDVLSLHAPLNEETKGVVDSRLLGLMKSSAFLINTSRGAVINEQDLASALSSAAIAGAGLDVLTHEPPEEDNPLIGLANCIVLPHIAWTTGAARRRLVEIAARNLQGFMADEARNQVG